MNSKQQGSRTGRSFKKPAATIVAVAALGTGLALLGTTGASADTSIAASCNLLTVGVTGLHVKDAVPAVSHVVHHEAVTKKVIDVEAQDAIPEKSHTVHHDAEYKTVVDVPAHDEKVIDVPEHEEKVIDVPEHSVTIVDKDAEDVKVIDQEYVPGTPAVEATYKTITVPATYKTVHHDAVTHTVEHPAVTKQVLVRGVWYEKVIDQAYVPGVKATYETQFKFVYTGHDKSKAKFVWAVSSPGKDYQKTGECKTVLVTPEVPAIPEKSHIVKHEAEYKTVVVKEAWVETIVDKAAYDEKVIDVPEHEEKVIDTPAKDAVPEVPEVSHIEHHAAVTHEETIPATYKTVTIPETTKQELVKEAYDEKVIDQAYVPAVEEVSHVEVITPASDETVIDTPAEEGDESPNNVTVSVDGKTQAQVDFGTAWNGSYNLDGTKNHTYTVTVQSWDGADDVQKGNTQACVTTPGQVTPPKDGGGTGTTVVTPSKPVIAAVPVVKTPVAPAQAADPVNTGNTLAYTGSEGLEQGGLAALALLGLGGGALWLGRRAKHRA